EKTDRVTYEKTIGYFEELMKLLHPFMPFITEEIYHHLNENRTDDICVASYPQHNSYDNALIQEGEKLKEIISAIRDIRNKNGLSPKVKLTVHVQTADKSLYTKFASLIEKIANIEPIQYTQTEVENAVAQLVQTDKLFIETGRQVDADAEKKKISEEMAYLEGFIASVEKKLSNEKFVANAKPEVIANERKKLADGQSKLQSLKESMQKLS
ncbi:MAG TPA: class I tRNA ligase family protein, partial [Chitinophagales bacterium]|nr:class I tRNA ligase family protein [Chitinophagales bacterium]